MAWAVYRRDAAAADRADLATTCMTRVGVVLMMGKESLPRGDSGAGCVSCTFSAIATIRRLMIVARTLVPWSDISLSAGGLGAGKRVGCAFRPLAD